MKYTEEEPSRGRPRGQQSHSTKAVLDSIAHIAASRNVDPGLLLDAFREARIHKRFKCEGLEVRCREVTEESATFMVTRKDKILGQFPVEEEILRHPEHFKRHIPLSQTTSRPKEASPRNISELKPGINRVTVSAKVVQILPSRRVITRYGSCFDVSEVLLGDETGSIKLSLWDGQIDGVSVGDIVSIQGAFVKWFRDELQLRIGKKGTLTVLR